MQWSGPRYCGLHQGMRAVQVHPPSTHTSFTAITTICTSIHTHQLYSHPHTIICTAICTNIYTRVLETVVHSARGCGSLWFTVVVAHPKPKPSPNPSGSQVRQHPVTAAWRNSDGASGQLLERDTARESAVTASQSRSLKHSRWLHCCTAAAVLYALPL